MENLEETGKVPKDYLELVKKWQADFDKRIENAKFNEVPENYLLKLSEINLPLVKRYSTEKLAGIFSGCIEWRGDYPRQETDWFFAEKTIDFYVNENGLKGLAKKGIILGAYESLPSNIINEISKGRNKLPRDNFDVVHHGGTLMWLPYKNQMKKLPDNELIKYLQLGHQKLAENLDLFLGRGIFEVYQSVKTKPDEMPEHYGRILFH